MATTATCAMCAVLPRTLISSHNSSQSSHAVPAASSSSSILGLSMRNAIRSRKMLQSRIFCAPPATTIDVIDEEKVEKLETESSDYEIPTSAEIETLLREVCDGTKIAELDVKVGSFKLHVKRSVAVPKAIAAPPSPVIAPAAPATSSPPAPKPAAKSSGPKVSPMMSKAVAYHDLQKAAAESGVVFINATRVGLFRPSRLVKGKYGPPLCREGQTVKEGQVVCYLEQFGTPTPVEADIAGDVIKVLWEDGVPVGYGDPLIALKPKKA